MSIFQNAWGALIGFHISLLPVLFVNRHAVLTKFFTPVSKPLLAGVSVSGLLAGILLFLIWPYTGLTTDFSSRLTALGLSDRLWLPFILYFTLVNPWLEEAYWRFAFYTPSRHLTTVDFIFAGYHLPVLYFFINIPWMVLAFIILVLVGWFWRQISRYTGSLLPAILAHTLADLSILLVVYHFSS